MRRLLLSLVVSTSLVSMGYAQRQSIDSSTTITADLPTGIDVVEGLEPPTVVDLLDTAVVAGSVFVYDSSVFNMYGGDIDGDLRPLDSSTVNVFGGNVDVDVDARGSSTLNISGGFFDEKISAKDQSVVTISGGIIENDEGESLGVHNSAIVSISGGQFGRNLYVWDSGQLNLSGGSFLRGRLIVQPEASVDVYGYDLRLADDLLTGAWADGTPVSLPIWLDPGATVTLHNILKPDLNLDGTVDRADVAQLVRNLGSGDDAVLTDGDLDGDGLVTLVDLSLLQANPMRTLPLPAASLATAPEPSGLVLLWLGLVTAGAIGRYARIRG